MVDENGKPWPARTFGSPCALWIGVAQTLHTKSDDQGRFVLEISATLLAKIKPWDR